MQIDVDHTHFRISVIMIIAMLIFAYVLFLQTSSELAALLVVFGFILTVMDTAIGMGFGTVGTPILLILGFAPSVVVPSILIAQLTGAAFGSVLHRRYGNGDVLNLNSKDGKMALSIVILGSVGAIFGVLLAINISKVYVNTYIGLLVIVMGIIILSRPKLSFSWNKLYAISIISGFNKAVSGGGFGTVSTAGLLIAGHKIRNSIAITVFSVAVINFVGFLLYLLTGSITSFVMMIALGLGAIFGSQVGPKITGRLQKQDDIRLLGALVLVLGVLTIVTTYVKI